MKTLLKNIRTLVTCDDQDRVLHNVDLLLDGPSICAIGHIQEPADNVIDCRHMFVYPGLVNTHHHLYQYFTRNLPEVQGLLRMFLLILLIELVSLVGNYY